MLGSSPLSLLAPPLCWACRGVADGGRPLCRRCRSQLRFTAPEPLPAGGVPTACAVLYEGPARALVRGLKFAGARALADQLAATIAAAAPPGLLEGTLVPVPLPPARRRRREQHQTELLATALARRSGLAIADVLRRRGCPGPHSLLGRGARLAAAPGSVAVIEGRAAPQRAVLVDDVVTTGATLGDCARALREAGAREVVAVAYARTPGR